MYIYILISTPSIFFYFVVVLSSTPATVVPVSLSTLVSVVAPIFGSLSVSFLLLFRFSFSGNISSLNSS
jgi:hypothetical protein